MKRFLSTAMALFAIGMTIANAETMTIGYAESANSGKGVMGPGWGDNDWIEMAIYLPASTVNALGGNAMTAINGAVSNTGGIESIRTWVRTELDGENLAEGVISEENMAAAKKGYNAVAFDKAWQIPENFNKGVYVGYGIKIAPLSNAGSLCAISRNIPGAYFYRNATGEWKDYSAKGVACLDAVIEGENLPQVNLKLSNQISPAYYIASKDEFTPEFYIHNFGTKEITKFDIKATYSEGTTSVKTVEQSIKPNKMLTVNVDFAPGLESTDVNAVEYTIENILEGEDADPDDNKAEASFVALLKDYPRYVLSEEFTTEMCGSCPEAILMIHELLEKPEYANIIQVAHHAGYKTDFLTTPFHEEFTTLWRLVGENSAPNLSVDRKPVNLSRDMAFYPETKDKVETVWNAALKEPALVDVNIVWYYADDTKNTIKVVVTGEKSIAQLCEFPIANVMVIEDAIPSVAQANGGKNWKHDDVSRYVSAENYWGDPITFDDDNYVYTCEIPLDPSWNKDELSLVAYVANHGESNRDKAIMNAGIIKFDAEKPYENPFNGVEEINAGIVKVEYFDLTGLKTADPAHGIFIQKATDAAGKTSTRKIAVK